MYRRYRPDSFADVIGQEHVTAPLMAALDKNRVNHAYLFSGPRGCGKTTSARILARCLNCAQGPTSHPCGTCDSCIELARGGAGSLDVIEIDAASHGGVDDARDLRERATFAPIRDRYKIFIIDEAHMVTSAGFNALLKIVEEPPEHIKFIFATTEPDKVIGTIRSRTHHYPFRLVPPEPLMAYLALLCERENVAVAPGVLSLVVRAGGGSVRDSLSVLDQLMAGAGDAGLDYDLAVDLLGYTHASLLDDVVEALAANDSATVFKSVDKVIQTGHDPRRFVEDLLERFRDLIIVHAMPESAHAILRGTPDELIARMQAQAAQLGAAELSRAADITNAAFNEMTGATSPRLHLELLGARLLLPGADSSVRGMGTRLDQLERRLNYAGAPAAGNVPVTAAPSPYPDSVSAQRRSTPEPTYADPGTSGGGLAAVRAQLARARAEAGAEVTARHTPSQAQLADPQVVPESSLQDEQAGQGGQSSRTQSSRTWDDLPTPTDSPDFTSTPSGTSQPDSQSSENLEQTQQQAQTASPKPAQQQPAPPESAQPQSSQPAGSAHAEQPPATGAPAPADGNGQARNAPAGNATGIEVIRRAWPEILGSLRGIRMASWAIVTQNVVPQTFDGRELRVGLPSDGLIGTFSNSGHLENLQRAINDVLGISVQILAVSGEAPKASSEPNPKVPAGNSTRPQDGASKNSSAGQHPNSSGSALGTEVSARTEAESGTGARTGAAVAAPLDSWGLPTEVAIPASPTSGPTARRVQTPAAVSEAVEPALKPAVVPTPSTTTSTATAPEPSPVTTANEVAAAAAPVAPAANAPSESPDYWDGPTEPSDPWEEPGPDAYPASDPYQGQSQDQSQDQQPAPTASSADQETFRAAAPVPVPVPVVHTPPRVSPISAWTTGWDAPVSTPETAMPAATTSPEVPRRSAILAEQIAQQANKGAAEPAPQDWGVSLGQTGRSNIPDPGWGSMSTAPDWAQAGSPLPEALSVSRANSEAESTVSGTSEAAPIAIEAPSVSTPDGPSRVPESPGGEHFAPAGPSPASPSSTGTDSGPRPDFEAGQRLSSGTESQLGESPNYPTPAVAAQEAPVSNTAQGGAKLSMYQRMANSSAAQTGRTQTSPGAPAKAPAVEDVPSPDDVTIEESGVVGQAAVERILGGVLIEERPLN
nr:DNA polymerase III subunit gamma and tau [Arthrobacter sp. E3]